MSEVQQAAPHVLWLMIGATIPQFGSYERLAVSLRFSYRGMLSFYGLLCLDCWPSNRTLLVTV